ncbi:MAG TPA: Flp family type IVb pilin [Anaerolineaceae bacterium]|jgi:pilus assembly protein Flp/PilA|nr:Flp family type IVb pilin [Anaerolineaceae bacterium]
MVLQAKAFLSTLTIRDEKAQGLIEYALIILLIAIAVIVVLTALGGGIQGVFTNITNELDAAQ